MSHTPFTTDPQSILKETALQATAPSTLREILLLIPVFLTSAVVGFLCDRMHMSFGVLAYPDKLLGGQAPWVPPLFGGAGVAIVVGHRWLYNLLQNRLNLPMHNIPTLRAQKMKVSQQFAITFVAFVVAYACTAMLDASLGAWVSALLIPPWLLLMFFMKQPYVVAYSIGAALIGCAFESGLSSTGAFYYTHPDLGYIPSWLPSLYLWVGVMGPKLNDVTWAFSPGPSVQPSVQPSAR